MQSYLSLSPNRPQAVDFRNWLRVLKELDHLRTDKIELIERNRALLSLNEKLQTSLESIQEMNRNLGDEVASLRESNHKMGETIEKLKTLDHQMEETRRLVE